ncbi:MAG: ATP-binding protein [Myxococcales bacterium]
MTLQEAPATNANEHVLTRAKRGTLQAKFMRVMLGIMLPLSLAMLVSVTYVNYRANEESARETQRLIRAGIVEKARVLTENHALALRGLVADNAFGDVSSLVEQAAERDPDIVYGLFLAADNTPWAYISPTQKAGAATARDLKRYAELGLTVAQLHPEKASERAVRLFNQDVLDFAAPVSEDGELLGTIRYGFSTQRMHRELATARARADQALNAMLLTVAGLTILGIALGALLVRKALQQVSKPLNELTGAAYTIAEGRRDVRVQVSSGDELEILAAAFNHMLEVNQRAFEELEAKTEQALESARLKSEFLANMSHEIRTPMNGVMGLVKLMLGMPLDDKLRRYAETMDASSTALLTIINDVLDFSKMEAGKYTLHEAPFEPRIVVQDVAELLSTRASEKGLEIIYRVAKDVPDRIKGDADRFRQVLNNLVGNAVKFTETGEIFVELRVDERTDDEVVLHTVVNDTGIGIAEDDVKTIFDAFSQVDGSMVRKHGGTGLGLAISKRLIEMMGGNVGVWSRPGMGSQFWFTLKSGVEASANQPHKASHTGRSALVIEGNHRWRENHSRAHGSLGHAVRDGAQRQDRAPSLERARASGSDLRRGGSRLAGGSTRAADLDGGRGSQGRQGTRTPDRGLALW